MEYVEEEGNICTKLELGDPVKEDDRYNLGPEEQSLAFCQLNLFKKYD